MSHSLVHREKRRLAARADAKQNRIHRNSGKSGHRVSANRTGQKPVQRIAPSLLLKTWIAVSKFFNKAKNSQANHKEVK